MAIQGMFRLAPGMTHATGRTSVMEVPGGYERAVPDSQGNYLISEVGAGAMGLYAMGPRATLCMWLRQSNLGVRVQDDYGGDYHSDAMEHIYVQVGTFKPSKERYRSANPVGASGVAITKGVAAIGTGAVPSGVGAATGHSTGSSIGNALTSVVSGVGTLVSHVAPGPGGHSSHRSVKSQMWSKNPPARRSNNSKYDSRVRNPRTTPARTGAHGEVHLIKVAFIALNEGADGEGLTHIGHKQVQLSSIADRIGQLMPA